MKKLKIYPDTTIFNFVFADGDPEKKEIAVKFSMICLQLPIVKLKTRVYG